MSTILIPFVLGVFSVIQNGMNRNIGLSHGLSTAVVMNVAFATVLSVVFWFAARQLPGPELSWLSGTISFKQLNAWHLLPGTLGFLIVLGLPFAINQLGANRVFVVFVVAQIIGSFLWDLFVSHSPLIATRLFGVILTLAGVVLVSFR